LDFLSFFRTLASSEGLLRELELYRQQMTKWQLMREMNVREVEHFREESKRMGQVSSPFCLLRRVHPCRRD